MKRNRNVYINDEQYAEFARRADERGMSFSTWALQAMLAYQRLGRSKSSDVFKRYANGFPKGAKCPFCAQLHDPASHGDDWHVLPEDIERAESELNAKAAKRR
jgi:hypothetical protein